MNLVKETTKVLNSYGILINKSFTMEDKQEALYTKDMILFISEKNKSIGVSFFAPTIPERASNLTLMIKDIKNSKVYIMESFVFNKKNEYVSGIEAFKIMKDSEKNRIINNHTQDQNYQYMLEHHKLFEC